ncbi:hypothetical protein GCK72_007384 [Caenorhabditis remanei]|uniref:Uncharacterized protein n=1 Tax=Caenorhabditis remanei TaxID=31234 RepID=A0A6A5HIX2_CAERE|nr:hypothetical protein GCK72_007384 [Caenorhabditis remanei]KAF1767425.1 hypothetical protein GCK72_007384 [Caenorhabditis remanei]
MATQSTSSNPLEANSPGKKPYRQQNNAGIVLLDELDPDQNKADVEHINDEELDFGDVEYENMEFRNAPTDMDPGN